MLKITVRMITSFVQMQFSSVSSYLTNTHFTVIMTILRQYWYENYAYYNFFKAQFVYHVSQLQSTLNDNSNYITSLTAQRGVSNYRDINGEKKWLCRDKIVLLNAIYFQRYSNYLYNNFMYCSHSGPVTTKTLLRPCKMIWQINT